MSDRSRIEWTEATWNPVTGCDRVSTGCDHCYALTLSKRLKAMGATKYQNDGDSRTSGPGFGITLHPQTLGEPNRWRSPRVVFVNSMSDLFHEAIPTWFVRAIFDTMARAEQHTFQVLTNRCYTPAHLSDPYEAVAPAAAACRPPRLAGQPLDGCLRGECGGAASS
jgi:protein gp37